MNKTIDLTQTVYQLTETFPELIDILASLGFTEITKKAVRLSVGKLMTLQRGADLRGIDMDSIVGTLEANGFTVVGYIGKTAGQPTATPASPATDATQQIKALLRRINEGEAMESVRADFVRQFRDVPANDIMRAEQELISEGQDRQ